MINLIEWVPTCFLDGCIGSSIGTHKLGIYTFKNLDRISTN